MGSAVERTWWELRCNADEGWYVTRWTRRGILPARCAVEYGPMVHTEIYDVLDRDVSATLLEALLAYGSGHS